MVVNPVRPDLKRDVADLEVIDYSLVEPVTESIEAIKTMFGEDSEIYAIGYSLGSNHLLRHLGAHHDCKKVCGIRAAVSISGCYDIRATCIILKDRLFGMYDRYILSYLQESFLKAKFRATSRDPDFYTSHIKASKSLTDFDNRIRGPIFGYKGASRLFRNLSCDAFISSIETPLLAISTKDDTITDYKFVPVDDLSRNPNVIFATLERGGHCNLWYESLTKNKIEHKELGPVLAIEFFNNAHDYYGQEQHIGSK